MCKSILLPVCLSVPTIDCLWQSLKAVEAICLECAGFSVSVTDPKTDMNLASEKELSFGYTFASRREVWMKTESGGV